jgi:hypothetical protein
MNMNKLKLLVVGLVAVFGVSCRMGAEPSRAPGGPSGAKVYRDGCERRVHVGHGARVADDASYARSWTPKGDFSYLSYRLPRGRDVDMGGMRIAYGDFIEDGCVRVGQEAYILVRYQNWSIGSGLSSHTVLWISCKEAKAIGKTTVMYRSFYQRAVSGSPDGEELDEVEVTYTHDWPVCDANVVRGKLRMEVQDRNVRTVSFSVTLPDSGSTPEMKKLFATMDAISTCLLEDVPVP